MSSIKISKHGYNALTDTNPQHFQFDSDYNTLKFTETISQLSITVANWGGNTASGIGIVSTSEVLPSSYNYTPYISSYINLNGVVGYNCATTSGSYAAYTYYDPSSNSIVFTLMYGNTGTDVVTITALPYLFANPV
jgi:hypothetical protein